jgi:muramoyltetrapeptide carboxypeptidase LdcA involved in peptidoglycan recycling
MPGLRQFWNLRESDWMELQQILDGQVPRGVETQRIREISLRHPSRRRTLRGELVGGNLSVWNLMIGTPLFPSPKGKILFFEDIDEYLYRIDRMVQSLAMAGGFRGASAIVLGTFTHCEDAMPKVLKKFPAPGSRERERQIREPLPRELVPLRPRMASTSEIRRIFGEAAAQWKVPLFEGLAVGHGVEKRPLPLGARYEIQDAERLVLKRWD